MKEISIDRIEMVSGGGWSLGCTMAIIGAVGLVASIVSVPVSGPIGVATAVGLASTTIGTGVSAGEYMWGYIKK